MAEAPERIRLFLGVEISLAAVRDLGGAAESLRRKARAAGLRVRWVGPENYHVTLKFLGWTRPEAVLAISDVLAEPIAAVGEFTIVGRGLGAFPRADRARVLWAGTDDPAGGLSRLAEIVETQLEPVGFAREQRDFHAHVTLGRIRQPAEVQELLGGGAEKMFRDSRVTAVTLFESVLKSSGSEYRAQARFGLREAALAAKRQTESLQAGSRTTGSGRTGSAGSTGTTGPASNDGLPGAPGWQTT
ncbi:MAG TPA: RNA 2',3'-cyclic phosphodiesterase, partial [Haliangium sp.]|nr:RNA 2',3'-cyclic phosphodiesterase [Haliangium sp.]